MNTIQKIGLIILSLLGIGALIYINIKKKAKAQLLGNDSPINSNRRKLASNEKRYYGTPYSIFDLIKTTDTLKEINRKRYKFKDGTNEMIVTFDPDETNGWGELVAKHEVCFTKTATFTPDSTIEGASVKGIVTVETGVIYEASIHAPTDNPLGLIIKTASGNKFYLAYEGIHLNKESLKV